MTRVLHISADFPDALQPVKTRAIANLVDATTDRLDHSTYSLNRANGWLRPGRCEFFERQPGLTTIRYHAPRWGLMLARSMDAVAEAIAEDLAERGIDPDVIHGHKLSFEGLAAQAVARRLGKPFMISLQGNTDQKVISVRRDLHRRYRSVWHEAAHVFPFSPWIEQWCERQFGARNGPSSLLPCIVASERIIAPSDNTDTVCTAFNLDFWQNKNLHNLVKAVAIAHGELPSLRFKLAGGGSSAAMAKVTHLIEEAGIASITTMSGKVPPERIQDWMNDAALFVLPSRRETFGMVFIEALLAGTPIVYPRGTAVDGYFDGSDFARSVDAMSPSAIAGSIVAGVRNAALFKSRLSEWQTGTDVGRFLRQGIADSYTKAVIGLSE